MHGDRPVQRRAIAQEQQRGGVVPERALLLPVGDCLHHLGVTARGGELRDALDLPREGDRDEG